MIFTQIRDIVLNYKWIFLAVFLTRLAMLVYVFPDTERIYNGDSSLYEQYALSLNETGEYLAPGYATIDSDPFADMIRPPGYPSVMWIIYAVFGSNWGPWMMAFLSGLMSLCTLTLLILFIHLFGLHHARVALWIFVVDPVWIMYSKEILTEPFFVPLILAGLYFGIIALSRLTDQNLIGDGELTIHQYGIQQLMVLSGLFFGLATLFKPITLYAPLAGFLLILILFLIHIFRHRKQINNPRVMVIDADTQTEREWLIQNSKIWLTAAILFLLTAQSLIFTWQYRNYLQHNTIAFTSIQSENMMTGHAAFVMAQVEGLTHLEAQQLIRTRFNEVHPEQGRYTFTELSAAKSEIASEILTDNKMVYLGSIFRGMAITLFDPGRLVTSRTFAESTSTEIGLTNSIAKDGVVGTLKKLFDEQPGMSLFLLVHLIYLVLIFGLSVVGVYYLCKKYPVPAIVLGCFFLYLWVLGGPSGYARFRMYLSPFMILFITFLPYSWYHTMHKKIKIN